MNTTRITELINKLPLTLLLAAYLGYLGYDYYGFMHDEMSPLAAKKKDIEVAKVANIKAQAKLKELDSFVKSLEQKKVEIRKLALALQESKASISDRVDVPAFMKLAITEAKKVGLNVQSLKPGSSEDKEFYSEQTYNMTFRGAFVQLLTLVDRLSNVSEIVQIENYSMRPIGSPFARYVELQGALELKTFRYLGTKEDKIGLTDTLELPTGQTASGTGNASSSSATGAAPGGSSSAGGTGGK